MNVCMNVHHMCVWCPLRLEEEKYPVAWNLSYGWLWVLQTQPRSFARATSAFNSSTISQTPLPEASGLLFKSLFSCYFFLFVFQRIKMGLYSSLWQGKFLLN